MKTIYAVSTGDYSDYRVIALFSTQEKANELMTLVPGDYNAIEEFILDSPNLDMVKKGYSLWMVTMLKDGTTEHVGQDKVMSYHVSGTRNVFGGAMARLYKRSTVPAYRGKNVPDCIIVNVLAKDAKHAIKIANEKRIQMIASGEWE